VFQQKFTTTDGVEDFNFVSATSLGIAILSSESLLNALSTYTNGQLFYFTTADVFKVYNGTTGILTQTTDYRARVGRDNLTFHYVHGADDSSRIDPSASNIIDTYILTRSYDTDYRAYLNGTSKLPLPASSDSLFLSYNSSLAKIKSLSDEIIYHPVKYKVLFGSKANEDLRATFKIVKNPDLVVNDNDVKTRVIEAISQYFALENWDFGETFYFSELSAYVMNQLAPDIVSFVIVPVQQSQSYGSLYEIRSESDEIVINGATVDDVEIIDAITATRLQASGKVITSSAETIVGVVSSSLTTTPTTGGFNF
jgi:hypothetical protein